LEINSINKLSDFILLNDFEKRVLFTVVDISKYPPKEYNFMHEALKGYSKVDHIQPGSILVVDNVGYNSGKITVFDKELSTETTDVKYLQSKNFEMAELLMKVNLENVAIPKNTYEVIRPNTYIKVYSLNKSHYSMSSILAIVICLIIVFGVLKTKGRLVRTSSDLISLAVNVITWPLRAIGLIRGPNGKVKFFGKPKKNRANLTYNEVGILEKSS